jgi:hypothetical protein
MAMSALFNSSPEGAGQLTNLVTGFNVNWNQHLALAHLTGSQCEFLNRSYQQLSQNDEQERGGQQHGRGGDQGDRPAKAAAFGSQFVFLVYVEGKQPVMQFYCLKVGFCPWYCPVN